jgi:hypothetical protein
VFVVSGCAAAEQVAADNFESRIEAELGDGVELEIDAGNDSFRVEQDGIEFAEGDGLDRPEWLAAEVPLPPDLVITSTLVIDNFRIVRGVTVATADELGEFYRTAFEAAGYTIEQPWDPVALVAMKARAPSGDPVSLEYSPEEFVLVVGRE